MVLAISKELINSGIKTSVVCGSLDNSNIDDSKLVPINFPIIPPGVPDQDYLRIRIKSLDQDPPLDLCVRRSKNNFIDSPEKLKDRVHADLYAVNCNEQDAPESETFFMKKTPPSTEPISGISLTTSVTVAGEELQYFMHNTEEPLDNNNPSDLTRNLVFKKMDYYNDDQSKVDEQGISISVIKEYRIQDGTLYGIKKWNGTTSLLPICIVETINGNDPLAFYIIMPPNDASGKACHSGKFEWQFELKTN